MWRIVSLILLSAAFLPLISAQAPLGGICPMVDNTIDAAFKPCRPAAISLTGPRDYKLYSFVYGVDLDVSVTFTIRAVVGSVLATFTSGNTPFQVSTAEGPGILRLQPDSSSETEWTLRVESLLGLPSKFAIEITTSNMSTVANPGTRKLLASMFKECCDTTLSMKAVGMPCPLLATWTSATDATNDVCQSGAAHCTPQGTLDILSMQSAPVRYQGSYAFPPLFTDKCISAPPTALSSFTDLTHLEMSGLGLKWTVTDLVTVVKALPQLERLYLGYNRISGKLDADACPMFQGTPLKSLSFRNPTNLDIPVNNPSPPWNAIEGELHACVFNSSLENLNLVLNKVTGIASIPDQRSTFKSQLKNLRLYSQVEPSTGYSPTMKGAGIPKGLENLVNLEFLGLGGNQLGGSMSDLIVPPSLEWLDLSQNNLQGEIPDLSQQYATISTLIISYNPDLQSDITEIGVGALTDLLYLDISNTSIYGEPSKVDWSKLSNLEVLDASGTNMEGEIPATLAKLQYLQELVFAENPKILSQTSFANALTPNNNITIYDVHSSGLTDLPDGLQNLKFFHAEYANIYKTNAWVFDITDNDIEAPLPTWLVGPLQQPVQLYQTLQSTQDIYTQGVPQYVFAIQLNIPDMKEGNRLGCPNTPVPSDALQNAVELQFIQQAQYNALVNCYNGTELVPVASYLSWLSSVGPLPAPPPYTASNSRGIGAQSRHASHGKKSGLSAATLAGIVVGVLVGVAVLAAVVFVIVRVVVPKMKKKNFEKFQDTEQHGIQTNPYGSPDQFQMAVQDPVAPPQGPNAV